MMSPSAVISDNPHIAPAPCAIGATWPANRRWLSSSGVSTPAYPCGGAGAVTVLTPGLGIWRHFRSRFGPSWRTVRPPERVARSCIRAIRPNQTGDGRSSSGSVV
jgi:hypothetical protein